MQTERKRVSSSRQRNGAATWRFFLHSDCSEEGSRNCIAQRSLSGKPCAMLMESKWTGCQRKYRLKQGRK